MILMMYLLYLLLGCLLSLVLQIVNSEFGLQKDNVFVVISFLLCAYV